MSKSILVIDKPTNCKGCDFLQRCCAEMADVF